MSAKTRRRNSSLRKLVDEFDEVEETSGTIDGTTEDEEKSGTLDGDGEDEEKSGTLDGDGEDEEKSGTLDGFSENEGQSGTPYLYREDEVQSGTFDETDEDEKSSTSDDSGFESLSDMSFHEETEEKVIGEIEGTTNILQLLERVSVGQIYGSKAELQRKLRVITIFQNFDYTTYKSTKTLLVLKCFVAGCSWKIRASAIKSSSEFKVRKYIDFHTCSVLDRRSRHRQATSKCIGELYLGKFGKVGVGIRPMHIMDAMKGMYGVDIDYWKAYKALVHASALEKGTWESGYADLPMYLHKIKAANPGTITKLECDEQDRFKYLFIAFGACISGFQYIRNVVVVDGTHLKGKYEGVLLVAASQDGNGEIFPLAFGVVDVEDFPAWEWFLTQLRLICGNQQELVIISDRHKALRKSIRKVFPLAHPGMCTYHLHQNLVKRFKESDTLKLVKEAYRVYRISEFVAIFNDIRGQNLAIARYLEKANVCLWSRANFQGDRYDIMTSNIAESVNSVLKIARGYPVAYLLEELRKLVTRWFMNRREQALSLQTFFTPKVERILTKRSTIGDTLTVQHIDAHRSHVTGGTFPCVVDLQKMTCTCRVYDIDKIPCAHALAAAGKRRNMRLEPLVHPYTTKSNAYNAYAESVDPQDVEWVPNADVANKKCLPPKERRGAGRPKKSRYLSALEKAMRKQPPLKKMKTEHVSTEQTIPKLRKQYTCSQCKVPGHNRATCRGV
ncbi:unnamed protein product [Microthlaspi erraticum]|uniref:SWIM-type domain-containing protein n=1 Tax=Microthlaspi erraticum TaxID=1685480 RepID=A0A6D2K8T5_9BRAS|nr:unnamed protein product [Microthlaspi erraticum]